MVKREKILIEPEITELFKLINGSVVPLLRKGYQPGDIFGVLHDIVIGSRLNFIEFMMKQNKTAAAMFIMDYVMLKEKTDKSEIKILLDLLEGKPLPGADEVRRDAFRSGDPEQVAILNKFLEMEV